MGWAANHTRAERYAIRAEIAQRNGNLGEATRLYRLAALEEEMALAQIEQGKRRTLGITVVSMASLWIKANDLQRANQAAYTWLTKKDGVLPIFAIRQLTAILLATNDEIAKRYTE